jgi:HNH endonuclease
MRERRTTRESRKPRGVRRKMNCTPAELLAWIEARLIPEPNSGCFLWTGSVGSGGGGDFTWRGQRHEVSRFILAQATGPLLPGEQALHKCDVRLCARRSHLFRGTAKDNVQDMIAKGRHRFEGLVLMQTPGVAHGPYRRTC